MLLFLLPPMLTADEREEVTSYYNLVASSREKARAGRVRDSSLCSSSMTIDRYVMTIIAPSSFNAKLSIPKYLDHQ